MICVQQLRLEIHIIRVQSTASFQEGNGLIGPIACLVQLSQEAEGFGLGITGFERILKRLHSVFRLAGVHVGIGLIDIGTRRVRLNDTCGIEVACRNNKFAVIIPTAVEGLNTSLELVGEGEPQRIRDGLLVGRVVFNSAIVGLEHVLDGGNVLILVLRGKRLF